MRLFGHRLRRDKIMGRRLLIPVFLAVTLLVAPASCGRGPDEPDGPNVVLVVIDALRPDHLSCYGYERKTSPFIDSIAERACTFRNAYAVCSWTAPSMASLFTSLYPRSHGVLHGWARSEEQGVVDQEALSSSFLTLGEAFKQAGYSTFAVSANPHVSVETGFGQGFDKYTTLWFTDAAAMNDAVLGLQEDLERAGRFFLVLFYFDPHPPHYAREPWINEYSNDPESYRQFAGARLNRQIRGELQRSVATGNPRPGQALVDLYDSEIAYCDRHLRVLFDSMPLLKESVVAIVSDHGHELLDHDRVGHGHTLYEEVVRIPLIVKPAGGGGRGSVDALVSNIDVYPTLLAAAGIEIPGGMAGRNLMPVITGEGALEPRPVYMELDRSGDRDRAWRAYRHGQWKLVCRGADLRERVLFDLLSDPDEQANVIAQHFEVGNRMYRDLVEQTADLPVFAAPPVPRGVTEDQARKLRSLGYLR